MEELLRKRRYYRLGSILFNIGLFSSIAVSSVLLVYVVVFFGWVLMAVFALTIIIITFFSVLFSKDGQAFIGELFNKPLNWMHVMMDNAQSIVIPFCVIAVMTLLLSFIFLLLSNKKAQRSTKMVFCFILMALSIVLTIITVINASGATTALAFKGGMLWGD